MKRFEQSDIRLLDDVRGCVERMEVLEGPTGRRSWPEDVKARIVRESFEPGARVCDVARRHGLTPQHLSTWRSLARKGELAIPVPEEDLPAFAALEVVDGSPATSGAPIEIEAVGVFVRVAPDTPAARITNRNSSVVTGSGSSRQLFPNGSELAPKYAIGRRPTRRIASGNSLRMRACLRRSRHGRRTCPSQRTSRMACRRTGFEALFSV